METDRYVFICWFKYYSSIPMFKTVYLFALFFFNLLKHVCLPCLCLCVGSYPGVAYKPKPQSKEEHDEPKREPHHYV